MIIAITCVIAIAVIAFILGVRPKDLPAPEPVSPFAHLDERKAAIYENLRDLQFEFRVGKLSDADYQQTKLGLQRELAGVLSEIDKINQVTPRPAPSKPAPSKPAGQPAVSTAPAAVAESNGVVHASVEASDEHQCPHCGAKFAQPMRYCGECGKVMA